MPRSKKANTPKVNERAREEEATRAREEEAVRQAAIEEEEEDDIGKTLHVKEGKLGFVTNKGFISATNFVVDIESQVYIY